jgi:hypothetical protein
VMKGFPAFAISFAMLVQVWYAHSKYFRRYGLQDAYSAFLNAVLLFVVLFYTYPLKFLFTFLVALVTHGATLPASQEDAVLGGVGDVRALMIIYGLGFAAVFLLLALMYANAYRLRTVLGLNAIETFRTKKSLVDNVALCAIGLFSAGLAAAMPSRMAGLAGYMYFLIGIYHWLAGRTAGAREQRLTAPVA